MRARAVVLIGVGATGLPIGFIYLLEFLDPISSAGDVHPCIVTIDPSPKLDEGLRLHYTLVRSIGSVKMDEYR